MKNRNNILHEFFIVYYHYGRIKLHAEFFKPIIAKSDKSIFVRYDYGFDFLFHYFIQ